jgi:formylglycine-generating enzyme required for sulfatase activity
LNSSSLEVDLMPSLVLSLASIVLVQTNGGSRESKPPIAFEVTEVPRQQISFRTASNQFLEFRYIAPGTFTIGDKGYYVRSKPLRGLILAVGQGSVGHAQIYSGPPRKTTITKGFYLLTTKVTADVFCEFLNEQSANARSKVLGKSGNPSVDLRNGRYVSWYDIPVATNDASWDGAVKFCQWLGERTGRKVRLPTEAEWEFAAKGAEGREYPWGDAFHFPIGVKGDDPAVVGWLKRGPSRSGGYPKNATPEGILDLLGPTGEWCSDFYIPDYDLKQTVDPKGQKSGKERVVRGWSEPGPKMAVKRKGISPHLGEGFRPLVEVD